MNYSKILLGLVLGMALGMVGCQRAAETQTPDVAQSAPAQAAASTQADAPVENAPVNLLKNPGFEEGLQDWTWLDWSKGWSAFALSESRVHEGKGALHLPVLSVDQRPTVVWGGVQEIELPAEIPDCIDGYYYVENWESGNWKQYLQLVVIDLTHSLGQGNGQAQLRYIVSGSRTPPLTISNASYLFVEKERRDTPVIGQWTYFSVNPRQDFIESWHYTPNQGAKLRVLFEGRFDLHHDPATRARADVYYDDLYFGPKTADHCAD